MGIVIAIVLLLVIIGALLFSWLCVVPQGNAWVVERLGKYHDTWQAGLHLLLKKLFVKFL